MHLFFLILGLMLVPILGLRVLGAVSKLFTSPLGCLSLILFLVFMTVWGLFHPDSGPPG